MFLPVLKSIVTFPSVAPVELLTVLTGSFILDLLEMLFSVVLLCRDSSFFFSLVAGRPTVPSFRSSLWFDLFFRQWEVELDSLELAQLFSFFLFPGLSF